MTNVAPTETVKYYTRARKFPQLLGRLPDGTKIPGGPYTIHQLLSGIAMLFIAAKTMGVWGVFGTIGNILFLIFLVYGTIFVVGRMPTNGRNPFQIAAGFVRVVTAPRAGRLAGRPVRLRRARRVTHSVNIYRGSLPALRAARSVGVSADFVFPTVAEPTSAVKGSSVPLTALQSLLASTDVDDAHVRDHTKVVP